MTVVLAALLVLSLAPGCASMDDGSDGPLSWEAFKARAYREPDTGMYIFNWDEVFENEAQLREQYERYLSEEAEAESGIARSEEALIVDRVGGHDNVWPAARVINLSYCLDDSFGARKSEVATAIARAAADWQAATHVQFVYVPTQDGAGCSKTNNSVLFNVRQVSGSASLARSFMPSSSRSTRELVIDASTFGSISPFTLTGVLRHELGHILGFRHEHTRPEAGGVCFENNSWRALTTYDSKSVMMYPQCNGTQTGDLVLTARDKVGAAALYGAP